MCAKSSRCFLAEAMCFDLGGELMGNRTLQDEVGRLNTPVVSV